MEGLGAEVKRERRRKRKPASRASETQRLQEELQRKLAEQAELKEELEGIRSASGSAQPQSHAEEDDDDDRWSDTTGTTALSSVNRFLTASGQHQHHQQQQHRRGCADDSDTSVPRGAAISAPPPSSSGGVEERYRQRLARLENMVHKDEQQRVEREESIRQQLAEKEQLLQRFESELTRAKSASPLPPTRSRGNAGGGGGGGGDGARAPLSPDTDSPPKHRVSGGDAAESPAAPHASATPRKQRSSYGAAGMTTPTAQGIRSGGGKAYEMVSLGMSAFDGTEVSPTPLQKLASAAPPDVARGAASAATAPEEGLRDAAQRVVSNIRGRSSSRSFSGPRTSSLKREDYPSGAAGDDAWMAQVESVVLGNPVSPALPAVSAPVTPRAASGGAAQERWLVSPTRSGRKVSFTSPMQSAFVHPSPQQQQPHSAGACEHHQRFAGGAPAAPPPDVSFDVSNITAANVSANRTLSPTTPVPDPLTPGNTSYLSLSHHHPAPPQQQQQQLAAPGKPLTPALAPMPAPPAAGAPPAADSLSSVYERVLPIVKGRGALRHSDGSGGGGAGGAPAAAPAECSTCAANAAGSRELEAKLAHYTLLVEQFEDTVLKLSGCVDEKVVELREAEARAKALEADAGATLVKVNEEWGERLRQVEEAAHARFTAATAESARNQTAAERDVVRLQEMVRVLQEGQDGAAAGGGGGGGGQRSVTAEEVAELEEKFSSVKAGFKNSIMINEQSWKTLADKSQCEVLRLQADLSSLQLVVGERATENRLLSEKADDLMKEIESKEAKVQSLRKEKEQLAGEVEAKQDTITALKLVQAQNAQLGRSEAGDEIREMIVELKHEYMRLYDEKKTRVEQEAKDFYNYCKGELELRDKRLEQTRLQASAEAQSMLVRHQALGAEFSELQHNLDVTANSLRVEAQQGALELQARDASAAALQLACKKHAARVQTLERAVEAASRPGGRDRSPEDQVVIEGLQQTVETLRREKQALDVERQAQVDRLQQTLHERELALASLSVGQSPRKDPAATAASEEEAEALRAEVARLTALLRQEAQAGEALRRDLQEKSHALQETEEKMKVEFQKQYIDLQQVQGQFGKYEGEVSCLRAQLDEAQSVADRLRLEMDNAGLRLQRSEEATAAAQQERNALQQKLLLQPALEEPQHPIIHAYDPPDVQRRLAELNATAEQLYRSVETDSQRLVAATTGAPQPQGAAALASRSSSGHSTAHTAEPPAFAPQPPAFVQQQSGFAAGEQPLLPQAQLSGYPELDEYRRLVQEKNAQVLRETEELDATGNVPAPAPTMWQLMYDNGAPPDASAHSETTGPFMPDDQPMTVAPPQPPPSAFAMPPQQPHAAPHAYQEASILEPLSRATSSDGPRRSGSAGSNAGLRPFVYPPQPQPVAHP